MSELIGDWDKLNTILHPARMKAKIVRAQKKVGVKVATAVKKGIQSGAPGGQAFKSLSELTIERKKKSSKPLIDHGDLIGNITHEEPDDVTVWVGVKRSARGRGGNLANIAEVHEYGCTIAVTPKMRGFLHREGIHLRPDTSHIHIPPRPFLRPTLSDPALRDEIADTYLAALKEAFLT